MMLPKNPRKYSTPVNVMVAVMHRMNPEFSVHYLEFLLSHMHTGHFLWLGNLPLMRVYELLHAEPNPVWVPQSFVDEIKVLRTAYESGER